MSKYTCLSVADYRLLAFPNMSEILLTGKSDQLVDIQKTFHLPPFHKIKKIRAALKIKYCEEICWGGGGYYYYYFNFSEVVLYFKAALRRK